MGQAVVFIFACCPAQDGSGHAPPKVAQCVGVSGAAVGIGCSGLVDSRKSATACIECCGLGFIALLAKGGVYRGLQTGVGHGVVTACRWQRAGGLFGRVECLRNGFAPAGLCVRTLGDRPCN